MVMMYERGKWLLHIGAAYNQNKENASGAIYNSVSPGYAATTNGGTMYKSLQYLYAGKKFEKGNASFLLLSDQFNRYEMQTVEGTAAQSFVPGVWTRVTTGFYYTNRFKA